MDIGKLKPGDSLPPLPPEFESNRFGARTILADGLRSQYSVLLAEKRDREETGAQITIVCNTATFQAGSVSVFRNDKQYMRHISNSPTGLYGTVSTNLFFTPPLIDSSYSRSCRENYNSIGNLMYPFRKAVETGDAYTQPKKNWRGKDLKFLDNVLAEYNQRTERMTGKISSYDKIAATVFYQGQVVYGGLDLDNDQELDILVMKDDKKQDGVILYHMENAPGPLKQALPRKAMTQEEAAAIRIKRSFQPQSNTCQKEFWIPPTDDFAPNTSKEGGGWIAIEPTKTGLRVFYRTADSEAAKYEMVQGVDIKGAKPASIVNARPLQVLWENSGTGYLVVEVESTNGKKACVQITCSVLENGTIIFHPTTNLPTTTF